MKTFLAGLGTGVALGMIVAPRSGAETRDRLKSKAEDMLEATRDEARDLARRGNELLASTREQAAGIPDAVSSAIQQGRNQARELLQRDGGTEGALNRVSRDDLLSVYGIGPVLADKIIKGRPYNSLNELVERGILPESTLENLKRELLKQQSA